MDKTQQLTLNNLGASLLYAGEYNESVEFLREALKLSMHELEITRFPLTEPVSLGLDKFMIKASIVDSRQHDHCDDEQLYVYPCPIQITPPTMLASSVPETFQFNTMISVVAMFNLALTYHMAAMCKKNDASLLIRSKSLYERTLQLVQKSGNNGCTFFIMATINNLGQVEKMLHDDGNADKHFCQLLSLVNLLADWNHDEILTLDGFISNILYSICTQRYQVAPAA